MKEISEINKVPKKKPPARKSLINSRNRQNQVVKAPIEVPKQPKIRLGQIVGTDEKQYEMSQNTMKRSLQLNEIENYQQNQSITYSTQSIVQNEQQTQVESQTETKVEWCSATRVEACDETKINPLYQTWLQQQVVGSKHTQNSLVRLSQMDIYQQAKSQTIKDSNSQVIDELAEQETKNSQFEEIQEFAKQLTQGLRLVMRHDVAQLYESYVQSHGEACALFEFILINAKVTDINCLIDDISHEHGQKGLLMERLQMYYDYQKKSYAKAMLSYLIRVHHTILAQNNNLIKAQQLIEEYQYSKQFKESIDLKYKCRTCKYSCNDITSLFNHYQKFPITHYVANISLQYFNDIIEVEKFRCPFCGRPYKHMKDLFEHVAPNGSCQICARYYPAQKQYDSEGDNNTNAGQKTQQQQAVELQNQLECSIINAGVIPFIEDQQNPQNPPPDPNEMFPIIQKVYSIPVTYILKRTLCESDEKMLDIAYAELATRCSQNGSGVLRYFNDFLQRFSKVNISGTPMAQIAFQEKSEQQKQKDAQLIQYYIHKLSSVGKAIQYIEQIVNPKATHQILPFEKRPMVYKRYLEQVKQDAETRQCIQNISQFIRMTNQQKSEFDMAFDSERIAMLVNKLRDDSDAGPTGINGMHLKYLANSRPKFCELIGLLAKKLLQQKDSDKTAISAIFGYKLILIPKEDLSEACIQNPQQLIPIEEQKFRPIIVAESLLKVVHKIFLQEINSKDGLEKDIFQLGTVKNGIIKAKQIAAKALRDGKNITKLDLKNAFNSVPRGVLIAALQSHGINEKFIAYIKHFLKFRKCLTDNIEYEVDGVPQGDSLSVALFTATMSLITHRINEYFTEKKLQAFMIAYIDDCLIISDNQLNTDELYNSVKLCFKEMLNINTNDEKKQTTQYGGIVQWLGQDFNKDGPIEISNTIDKNLKLQLEKILKIRGIISNQDEFLLLQKSIIPSYNYGPLLELNKQPNKQAYLKMDEQIVDHFKKLTQMDLELPNNKNSDQQIREFMVKPKEYGGLNLLLAGEYYEEMQKVLERNINPAKQQLYPYADYFQLLREMSNNEKYKQLNEDCRKDVRNEAKIPKVGYALNTYKTLSVKEFLFLTQTGNNQFDLITNQKDHVQCDRCLHWYEKGKEKYHCNDCCINSTFHIKVHDVMVDFLINELKKNKNNLNVQKICKANDNTTNEKRPDIEITSRINDQVCQFYLDVAFTHKERMQQKYNEKMNKHNNNKNTNGKKYHGTLPIVFGKNCTIHPESLQLLRHLKVNMEHLYQFLGLCLAKHYQLCSDKSNQVYKLGQFENKLDQIEYQEMLIDKDTVAINEVYQQRDLMPKEKLQEIVEQQKANYDQRQVGEQIIRKIKLKPRPNAQKPPDNPKSQEKSDKSVKKNSTQQQLQNNKTIKQNKDLHGETSQQQKELPVDCYYEHPSSDKNLTILIPKPGWQDSIKNKEGQQQK